MVGAQKLSDRYRIDEKLATGGMGAVYAATDERLNRTVAVKLLKEELAHDPRFVERFRREARAAAALSHPNVAGVFDHGEDEGRHFIVMELAPGHDLARVLREEGAFTPDRTMRIATQIADALAHAHSAGLVHRDVKPHNVIVDDNDRVKVTDFGIARAAGESTLTATGSVLGSAHYISPEQASGTHIGPASDIYSLGIVVYEMLTGALPFTGESALGVAMRHVNDDVPAPSSLNPDVPAALDAVVARATAKEPRDRFRDATEMSTALTQALVPQTTEEVAGSGTAVLPEAWPFPAHPPRWDPTRLGRIVLGIFAVLIVIAAALLAYRLIQTGERIRDERANGETGGFQLLDYRGLPADKVEESLIDKGLVVRTLVSPLEGIEAGIVWGHDPEEGETVDEGDTVTLYVGTGDVPEEKDDDGPGRSDKDHGNGHDKKDKDD